MVGEGSDSSQISSPIHDAQRQEDDDLIRLPLQPNGSAYAEREDTIEEISGKSADISFVMRRRRGR